MGRGVVVGGGSLVGVVSLIVGVMLLIVSGVMGVV